MRTIGRFLASVLLVAAVGCGSESGSKPDTGAAARLDGGTPTGGVDGGVDAPATNPGIDGPATNPGIDAPATNPGIDAPATNPGIDAPATNPGIDAPPASTRLDGATGLDGASTTRLDGGPAIDTRGIDGGAAAATCTLPTCMVSAAGNCVPSGACVTETDVATFQSRTCYANGVKMVSQTGLTGLVYTLQNGSAVCYSMSIDLATLMGASADGGAPLVIPVKDANGTQIATLSVDTATQKTMVTCPGAQPVVLDSSCTGAMSFGAGGSTTNCTTGTCAP